MEILFYKKIFNRNFSIYDRLAIKDIPQFLPPGYHVYFSNDPESLKKADVVIFDMPFLVNEYLQMKKPENQIWVGWLLESLKVYPWLTRVFNRFDLTISYLSESDVRIPFYCYDFLIGLRDLPEKKSKNICSFVGSSVNESKRLEYLSELWKYIEIDTYGWKKNSYIKDRHYLTKQDVSKHYRFTISFENSVAEDFVTEKFFDPLLVGSVPLYLGAPNIDEFAPSDKCYINVLDYSPKELACKLNDLIEDEKSYDEMLQWKKQPYRQSFINLLEEQKIHFINRLIEKIR